MRTILLHCDVFFEKIIRNNTPQTLLSPSRNKEKMKNPREKKSLQKIHIKIRNEGKRLKGSKREWKAQTKHYIQQVGNNLCFSFRLWRAQALSGEFCEYLFTKRNQNWINFCFLNFQLTSQKLWLTLPSFFLNPPEFTTINNFSLPLSSFMTSFEQPLQLLSRVIYAVVCKNHRHFRLFQTQSSKKSSLGLRQNSHNSCWWEKLLVWGELRLQTFEKVI